MSTELRKRLKKTQKKILLQNGILQGFMIGPLLFLNYVNDLPSCLKTVLRFFVDNTAHLIDSNNKTELQTLTNTELANINQWITANNLVVNANKTIVLNIFPNMHNNNATLSYVLKDGTVCSSNSAKLSYNL